MPQLRRMVLGEDRALDRLREVIGRTVRAIPSVDGG
jgi:hypothetical protein